MDQDSPDEEALKQTQLHGVVPLTTSALTTTPNLCHYCKHLPARWYDALSNGWCDYCRVRGVLINWGASYHWLRFVPRKDCMIALGKASWQEFVSSAREKDVLDVWIRIKLQEKRLQASLQNPPRPRLEAIETKYNGYRFRSRVEARWAVFMSSLGVTYYYEHEGYSLDGVRYLPDFWLPKLECYFEVKGAEPTEEERRLARLLALTSHKPVYIVAGNVGLPTQPDGYTSWKFVEEEQEQDHWWCECQLCGAIGLYRLPSLECLPCTCISPMPEKLTPEFFVDLVGTYRCNSPRLAEAFTAARQARFEHGESPD